MKLKEWDIKRRLIGSEKRVELSFFALTDRISKFYTEITNEITSQSVILKLISLISNRSKTRKRQRNFSKNSKMIMMFKNALSIIQ